MNPEAFFEHVNRGKVTPKAQPFTAKGTIKTAKLFFNPPKGRPAVEDVVIDLDDDLPADLTEHFGESAVARLTVVDADTHESVIFASAYKLAPLYHGKTDITRLLADQGAEAVAIADLPATVTLQPREGREGVVFLNLKKIDVDPKEVSAEGLAKTLTVYDGEDGES